MRAAVPRADEREDQGQNQASMLGGCSKIRQGLGINDNAQDLHNPDGHHSNATGDRVGDTR